MLKKLLLVKSNNLLIQLFRYTIAGGLAACVDFGSFALFIKVWHIHFLLAVFFSFTLGTLTNFTLCNLFIFQRRNIGIARTYLRHYISSIGGLVTNWTVMLLLVEVLHNMNLLLDKIIAMGVAFIVNFTLIRSFAFQYRRKTSAANCTEEKR